MLKVEVVAKFVAERAHERSERSDLLTHRRPHPYPDEHGLGLIIPRTVQSPSFHVLVAVAPQARGCHTLKTCRNLRRSPEILRRHGGQPHSAQPSLPTRWILQSWANVHLAAGQAS